MLSPTNPTCLICFELLMYRIKRNSFLSQSLVHFVVNWANLQVALRRSNLQSRAAYNIFISIDAAIGCSRPRSSSAIGGVGGLTDLFVFQFVVVGIPTGSTSEIVVFGRMLRLSITSGWTFDSPSSGRNCMYMEVMSTDGFVVTGAHT